VVPDEAGRPEFLAALLEALTEAEARLDAVSEVDASRLRRRLEAARQALQAGEGVLALAPSPASAVARWRHELRGHVNTMTGWSVVLSQKPEPVTLARASDAIERAAKALAQLLAQPPR
jgi:hypothetical protein